MPRRLRGDRRRGDQHRGRGPAGPRRLAAAAVTSAESSDEKLERLREFGLDHGINYANENFVERTRELTDGRGADLIIDSVGGQNLVDSIAALAYRGTLVSVGVSSRAGSSVEAQALWAQNNTLRGVFLGGAMLTELPRIHAMIADLLDRVARGELRVEVDRTFPLAAASRRFPSFALRTYLRRSRRTSACPSTGSSQASMTSSGIGRLAIQPKVIGSRRNGRSRSCCMANRMPPGIHPAAWMAFPGRPGGTLSNA